MDKKAQAADTPSIIRDVMYAVIVLVVILFILYLLNRDAISRLLENLFRSLRFGL